MAMTHGAMDNLNAEGKTAFQLARKYARSDMIEVLRQHRHETNERVVAQKRTNSPCHELNSECPICREGFVVVVENRLRGSSSRNMAEARCLFSLERFHPECVHHWAQMKHGECALCKTTTFDHYDVDRSIVDPEPPSTNDFEPVLDRAHPSTGSFESHFLAHYIFDR